MTEYLAKYHVSAVVYYPNPSLPGFNPRHPEYRFKADSPEKAKEKAEKYTETLKENYRDPIITLESLLEVEYRIVFKNV